MKILLHTLATIIAGIALVYAGFYLTGIVATRVDPRTLGLTGSAAFALIMFLAWAAPAAATWLVAGALLKQYAFRYASLCGCVEILGLLAVDLLAPTDPVAIGAPSSELGILATVLVWPILFVATFSPLAALLGSKLRASPASGDFER